MVTLLAEKSKVQKNSRTGKVKSSTGQYRKLLALGQQKQDKVHNREFAGGKGA